MSHLITQDRINVLEPSKRKFVALRAGNQAIRGISESVVKSACAEILTRASFDMNSPMANDPKMLLAQTEALFGELKGKFKDLTIPELKEAFNMGIREEFGNFFGLCPATYHKFIKSYYSLPERSASWLEYLKLTESPEPKLDKVMFSKQACVKAFENYRDMGLVPFSAWAYYDIINELIGVDYKGHKTLVTDAEVRKTLFAKAKEEHTSELLKAKRISESKGHFNEANAIMAVITSDFEGHNGLVHAQKKELLIHFFKELIREKKNLEL